MQHLFKTFFTKRFLICGKPHVIALAPLSALPVTSLEIAFKEFSDFAATLKGDEKGDPQLFLIRLLEAFGHDDQGLSEGSRFENRGRFPVTKRNMPTSSGRAACSSK